MTKQVRRIQIGPLTTEGGIDNARRHVSGSARSAAESNGRAASPRPPKSRDNGEANHAGHYDSASQVPNEQEVTQEHGFARHDLLHHQASGPGEANEANCEASGEREAASASPQGKMSWGEAAAELFESAAPAEEEASTVEVVKPEKPRVNSKRNSPLTESEEDRFLLCLNYGFSLRQAAAAVGCSHSTMVKRAKRDAAFAHKIAQAKASARLDPLWEITIASRKSWRAAAWLLTYLERREGRGKAKGS